MHSETLQNYIVLLINQATEACGFKIDEGTLPQISFPDLKFGDFSTNFALILAKKIGKNPAEIAKQMAVKIQELDEIGTFEKVEPEAGFVNFTLSADYLLSNLQTVLNTKELYGSSFSGNGKKVVVEYFQNNVAKPPHVGHLRSAVIGDCLLRVLKSQGYKTISDTHIGDWGVQFGILLFAYKEFIKAGGNKTQIETDPINELNKLYVDMSARIEADETLRERGKEEFVKLEKGDTENRQLWQWFVEESLEDFERYRKILHLEPFDHNLGESFYEDKMQAVLEGFKAKGLITVGETGEQYVDLERDNLGRCILVKSDSSTTYLLRDFATYIFRKGEFDFYKNIYVVDNRQSHHFKQLFKVLELVGYSVKEDSLHVDFGFMSLPEGAISTRKGNIISLENLIGEAKTRALKIIEEKNPQLENKEAVADEVALAAIKYFDLSHNRKTEIVFTWDKALSFEGNTGPYLQYTHARICGILRRVEGTGYRVESSNIQPSTLNPHEYSVLRKLVQYPEIVAQVAEDLQPNIIANYLFELSQNFNAFYQEVPVLSEADGKIKNFRLMLITGVAQVIKNGLHLLGIEAPEEM